MSPTRVQSGWIGSLCAGVALTVVTLAAGLPARAQQSLPGYATYTANGCSQCHGYVGQGGEAGPRIGPSPYPYEAFAQLVRRPASEMPAYAASVLNDADLREIYAYLRSLPEPPPLEELAALRQ